MKAYPTIEGDEVLVRIRADNDAGVVGDYSSVVAEGDELAGIPYQEWLSAARSGSPVTLPDLA